MYSATMYGVSVMDPERDIAEFPHISKEGCTDLKVVWYYDPLKN